MASFCGIVFSFFALLFALSAVWHSRLGRKIKNVKVSFVFGVMAVFLALGGIVSFTIAHADAAAPVVTMKAKLPPPKPTPPRYNPGAILTQARQADEQHSYKKAVVLLSELHKSDFHKLSTQRFLHHILLQEKHAEIVQRENFANSYEGSLLGAGEDAVVRAQGRNKTTLYLEMPSMSRPLVYQLTHPDAIEKNDIAQGHIWKAVEDGPTDFMGDCAQLGFTRVIFTDGAGDTWIYPTS